MPEPLLRDLTAAAGTAGQLDITMEDIHRQVRGDGGTAQYVLPVSV